MKKEVRLVIFITSFAAFLAVSLFAYNKLSESRKPDNMLNVTESSGEISPQSESAVSNQEKVKAPDFTVIDRDGNKVKLSDMFGKPVVVNFWASWCPPCKAEMPDFDKVYGEIGSDVTFMMIDLVGGRETRELGEKYVDEQGFSFPVYFDTEQEAAMIYGITAIPTSLFIDKDGYIVTAAQGAIDEKTLRHGVSLIAGGEDSGQDEQEDKSVDYRKITPEQAKEMMDSREEYILLDVRMQPEFDEGHIEGAILIPDTEIASRAGSELPDKDAVILVYCRSGRRSAFAAGELAKLGYSNVYDFGGIADWPFDVVK